jgi:hypothetical protein
VKANTLVTGLYFAAAAVLLAPALAKGTTNQLKMELKDRKRVQFSATAEASSTLHKTEQDGRDAFSRIILAPGYLLTEDYRVSASGQIIQHFNEEQKTEYSNTRVNLTRSPLQLTQDTALILVAGGRLPTNSEDRDNNTYRGAVLVDPRVITDWNIKGFNFSTTYELLLTKNFHKYDRNNLSQANTEYSALHYFGLDIPLVSKLVLTLDGDYTYARSYQDTAKTVYSVGQSITYQMPKWSVTVGHTNSANMLEANGRDTHVSAFDKHTSAVYGNVRVIY